MVSLEKGKQEAGRVVVLVPRVQVLGLKELRAGRGEDELGSQGGFFLEEVGFEQDVEVERQNKGEADWPGAPGQATALPLASFLIYKTGKGKKKVNL